MSRVQAPTVHPLLALERRLGIRRSRGESRSQVLLDNYLTLYSITTELTREMCSSATLAFVDLLTTRLLPDPQSWRVEGDWYKNSRSVEWIQSSRSATARVNHYWAKLESQVFVSGRPRTVTFSLELELSRPSILQRLCDRVINSRTSSLT